MLCLPTTVKNIILIDCVLQFVIGGTWELTIQECRERIRALQSHLNQINAKIKLLLQRGSPEEWNSHNFRSILSKSWFYLNKSSHLSCIFIYLFAIIKYRYVIKTIWNALSIINYIHKISVNKLQIPLPGTSKNLEARCQ